MRKFILIAGFALVSVAAQAGERSLSLGGGETTKVSAPAKATEGPRTAEAPQAAEAPKYVERPAAVEPKTETTKSETARSETGRAAESYGQRMKHRPAGMQQRYAGRPQGAGAGGMSARRAAMMQRGAGQHRMRFGIRARIIMALHRHGIYW
jgi:outer membrane receptor protein involved in Fe transport